MSGVDPQALKAALAENRPGDALHILAEMWRAKPGQLTAGQILGCRDALLPRLKPFRISLARSYTLEPLLPLLRARALLEGVDLSITLGEFNNFGAELFDASSALLKPQPDALFLALQTRDVAPKLWTDFPGLDAAAAQKLVDETVGFYQGLIGGFRRASAAPLILQGLEAPARRAFGALDARLGLGQAAAIEQVNDRLRAFCAKQSGVYFLDMDGLVARFGRQAWYDERKWLTARMPIAAPAQPAFLDELLRFLVPLCRGTAKVLVLDLDNTLWGGVIGEEGVNGIGLSHEYPGAAFRALQQVALDLHKRGILIVLCSKNNEADAFEAFDKHPEMLLRREHVTAHRINWEHKADNLRSLAKELNLGLDSFVFVDDNPAERALIRQELPDVRVLELPPEPMLYAEALQSVPWFEQLTLTAEDLARAALYAEERQRQTVMDEAGSLEAFLASLDVRVAVAPVDAGSLARAAQLTQKTNQFNLTTRRYQETALAERAASAQSAAYVLRSGDRFGDNGIVCVGLLDFNGPLAEIDTLLMSCRVIGRGVETAFLSVLMQQAALRGAKRIGGWFLPTAKNAPSADFYARHGFAEGHGNGEGGVWWDYDLGVQGAVPLPAWIRLEQ